MTLRTPCGGQQLVAPESRSQYEQQRAQGKALFGLTTVEPGWSKVPWPRGGWPPEQSQGQQRGCCDPGPAQLSILTPSWD